MDKVKPAISVIIPAYNASVSLQKCVESVLSQTLPSREIIVIDDGSTDDTAKIARDFGQKLIFIRQENQGQGAARNTGIKMATGEYLAFLDADDYWQPELLETCVGFLKKNLEAIAVNSAFMIKRGKKSHTGPSCLNLLQKEFPEGIIIENFFEFWAKYDHIRTGTALIRTSIIKQAGLQLPELRISQDLEYWGYLATFGSWGFIPKVLWVGDSATVATKTGWRKKYTIRRHLCPEVENWQKRILPRLKEEEIPGFEVVRGRVAAGYAHNKILAGNLKSGFSILRKYGRFMPSNRVTKLMKWGDKLGPLGRIVAANILRLREFSKG